MDARAELACYPQSSFYLMSFGLVLVRTIGSLSSAFAPARDIPLAVKPAYAFARPGRFPSAPSRPYRLLHYFLGGKCPIQTARQTLSRLGFRFAVPNRLESTTSKSGISLTAPVRPKPNLQSLPPMLRIKAVNPISSCSKASGVFSSNHR